MIKKKIISLVLTFSILMSFMTVGMISANAEQFIPENQKTADKVQTEEKQEKNYVEGEAVVLLNDANVVSEENALSDSIDAPSDVEVENVENFTGNGNDFSVVTVSSDDKTTKELVEELNDSKDIVIAEPNYKYKTYDVTNDTYSKYQWSLENKGQNNGEVNNDINPENLWNKETAQTKEQVVAVLDTGVDYTHEDLKDKMWVNPYRNKLAGNCGLDFTGTTKDGSPMDDNGHGTHCAGIIAAQQNNNLGISGVSQNTKVMAIKWLNSNGEGDLETAVSAYNYIYRAMKLGVNVVAINNSWGGGGNSKILLELINKVGKLGAVSVCAAGNDSVDIDKPFYNEDYYEEEFSEGDEDYYASDTEYPNPTEKPYPAAYESDYIITVAATDEYGDIAKYSNYGKDTVDVAAPGTNILSSVSYNCFNPEIYNDIDERTSLYITKDFNIVNENKDCSEDISIKEISSDYFTDTKGDTTSLEISIKDAVPDKTYYFTIPYTATATEDKPDISLMAKYTELPEVNLNSNDWFYISPSNIIALGDIPADGDLDSMNLAGYTNELVPLGIWRHIMGEIPNKKAGDRKVVIAFSTSEGGDCTFQLDCLGVSKGTKGENDTFGKYDFYTGTSMATPVIAGEVCLLKEKYPELTSKEIVEKIIGCVKQSDKYDYAVKTSGINDLTKTDSPAPIINSVINSKDKTLTIKGANLQGAKVKINDKDITVKKSDKNNLTTDVVSVNDLAKITVSNDNGYCKKDAVLISGTKYSKSTNEMGYYLRNNEVCSDGKLIYTVNDSGDIKSYNTSGAFVGTYSNDLDKHFKDTIGSASHTYDITNVTYSNGNIYFIANLNLLTQNKDYIFDEYQTPIRPFYSESVIVKFNISSEKYSYIKFDENLDGASIAVYNGTLYLIGGYDYTTSALSKNVYKYTSGKWTKVSELPSGRALGKCVQVNNQLVYTLGTDGSENVPKNLIYNGKTWTESKVTLSTDYKYVVEFNDEKTFTYYYGGVDLISGGLLYTGVLYNGYGDTVKYTVSSDKFTHMDNYYMTKPTDIIRGVVVNNKFIGTACEVVTKKDIDIFTGETVDFVDFGCVGYTFSVSSGMYKISANAPHGKISGIGYYYYGDTATVKATSNSGYKVRSITVNGKTYNKTSVSFKVTKSTTVKVNYTPLVKSIKMSATKKTLKKNKSFNLSAKISASTGANKTLVWKNSKTSVVKMTKKNNTTVKVTAKKKGSAVISATAKDGSKKSAKCKVTVK